MPNGIAGTNVVLCQHIGKLLQIADNHDIACAGKGQYAGSQIDLRGLVHDKIIVDMIDAQRPFDGIGCAEHHRVFVRKRGRFSPEITLFKALSFTSPRIPRC